MNSRHAQLHTVIFATLSVCVLLAFSLVPPASAAFNPTINYQGKLTDDTGATVPDGTYNMRFWLLTSPSIATTSAVWTESLTGTDQVQVTNGLFSVMLGSTTPLTSVDFNQTLYLGVEIGGTGGSPSWDGEMSPRKIIGAVPAAFEAEHAADADTLGGVASTSFLRSDQADTATGLLTFTGGIISNSSSTITSLTAITATTTNLVVNSERFTDLTGTGLQNNSGVLTVNTSYLDTLYASTTAFDTSAELRAILTDETGTGNAVFSASPTFTGTVAAASASLSGTLTFSGSSGQIVKSGTAAGQLDIDFPNATSTSQNLRLFRNTNTTGSRFFTIYKGDGTATSVFQVTATSGALTINGQTSDDNLIRLRGISALGERATMLFQSNDGTQTYGSISAHNDQDPAHLPANHISIETPMGDLSTTVTRLSILWGVDQSEVQISNADLLLDSNEIQDIGNTTSYLSSTTWQMSGANGTNGSTFLVSNTSNSAVDAPAIIEARVGGNTTTGDPQLRLGMSGGNTWHVGVDNSNSDLFTIGTSTTIGGSGTEFLTISTAGVVNVAKNSGSLTLGDGTNTSVHMNVAGGRTFFGYNGANAVVQGGTSKGILFNVNNGSFGSGSAAILTSGGNFGIATTTPSQKLTVVGNAYITGALYGNNNSAGSNGMVLQSTGSGFNWVATSTLGITGGLTSADIDTSAELLAILTDETGTGRAVFSASPAFSGTATFSALTATSTLTLSGTAANIALGSNWLSGDGDDEGIFIGANGNITIGTTTNNLGSQIYIGTNSTSYAYGLGDGVVEGSLSVYNDATYGLALATASAHPLIFGVDDLSAGPSMVIDVSGNIGIGTTTPNAKLNVWGNLSVGTSSTPTLFANTANGKVGIGTSTPAWDLSIVGTEPAILLKNSSNSADNMLLANQQSMFKVLYVGDDMVSTSTLLTADYYSNFIYNSDANLPLDGSSIGNILFGAFAGSSLSSGANDNNFLGRSAGNSATDGDNNNFFGNSAGFSNTSGSNNNYFGLSAGSNGAAASGSGNNAFGYTAGYGITTGSYNNLFGYEAGYNVAGGDNNIALGYRAGYNLSSGSNNIFLGAATSSSGGITTGSNNILIGYGVRYGLTSAGSNQLNIGNLLYGTGLGSGNNLSTGNIGIGTSTPSAKLTVAGNLRVTGALADSASSTGSNGYVLQSTGTGFNWVATSTLGLGGLASTDIDTSAELLAILTDETGSGRLVFSNAPAFSGTATFSALTATSTLTLSGTAANIALGSNWLSGDGGDEGIFVTSAGRVGIGTTTPADDIELVASTYPFLQITETSGTSNAGIGLYNPSTYALLYLNTSGNLSVETGGDAGTDFTITGTGNVGIGTTTPNQKLSIFRNGADAAIEFSTVSGANEKWTIGTDDSDGAKFKISSSSALGTNDRFVINGAGNIGIGTSSPASKLHVWGNFRVGTSSTPALSVNTGNGRVGIGVSGNPMSPLQVSHSGNNPQALVVGDAVDPNSTTGLYLRSNTLSYIDAPTALVMRTNGVERFYVASGGNVGIGTTTPSAKLTVAGNLRITGALADSASSTGSNGMVLQSTGTGFNWVATSTLGFLTNASIDTCAEIAAIVSGETGTCGSLVLSASPTFTGTVNAAAATLSSTLTLSGTAANIALGSNYLSGDGGDEGIGVDSSGKVGIGTTTPSYRFQVEAGTSENIALGSVGLIANSVWTTNLGFISELGEARISSRSTTPIAFFTGGTANSMGEGTERLRITNGGNIGIGTSTPNQALSIFRSAADAAVEFSTVSGANEKWTIGIDDSDGAKFKISSSSALGTNDRLVINGAGYVGIGDSTPEQLLDVEGSIAGNYLTSVVQNSATGYGQYIYINNSSASTHALGIDNSSGAVFRVRGNGNVAIGTTTPNQALTIFRNGADAAIEFSTVSGANEKWTIGTDDSDGAKFKISSSSALGTNDRFVINGAGNIGIGTASPSGKLHVYSGSSGAAVNSAADELILEGSGNTGLSLLSPDASNANIYFATPSDGVGAQIQWNYTSDLFTIGAHNAGADVAIQAGNGTDVMRLLDSGNVGIGTTTPSSLLAMGTTTVSGSRTAGIHQYFNFTNSVASAVYYGDNSYIVNAPTATSTLVGKMLRIEDDTTLGNTVRGLEVQAHRGTNTQGENTGISGFGRTFGVRGTTEGDAGGTFQPAGVFAQTRGTTQGNAIRAYSASITTEDLVSLFQDTSAFAGTGLVMNFGNSGGSFSSTTSKFVDFQNAGTSKFTVTAHGTTTIGDGTTNNMAGLQIGYGGLCVDNDGSCNASTTGKITSVSSAVGNSDLAEMYFSSEDLQPGEIIATAGILSIEKADAQNSENIIGVVSTKPGLTLGFDDTSLTSGQDGYPVALSGRVPVRLSTENGPIKAGDKIMLSSIPGVGMKATESGTIVGVALEDFEGEYAYSEGFIDQFGDDIAEPKTDPLSQEDDERIHDGCYFGGGGALGEEEEECTPRDPQRFESIETAIADEHEDMQEALRDLAREDAEVMKAADGSEVKIGQALMFVNLGWHPANAESMLAELTSTSTDVVLGSDGDETLWDRIKTLAQGFVDGVLNITGLRAENVYVENQLCVDGVCVTADDLRALLQEVNRPSNGSGSGEQTPPPQEPPEESTPEETQGGGDTEGGENNTEATPPPPEDTPQEEPQVEEVLTEEPQTEQPPEVTEAPQQEEPQTEEVTEEPVAEEEPQEEVVEEEPQVETVQAPTPEPSPTI